MQGEIGEHLKGKLIHVKPVGHHQDNMAIFQLAHSTTAASTSVIQAVQIDTWLSLVEEAKAIDQAKHWH